MRFSRNAASTATDRSREVWADLDPRPADPIGRQRAFTSPRLPHLELDFLTGAYAAVGD